MRCKGRLPEVAQVFRVTNADVTLPQLLGIAAVAAPVYLPSAAGAAVPALGTRGDLAVDLGGAIPPGLDFSFVIEKQIDGVWTDDAWATMTTGPYMLKGVRTTVNHFTFAIQSRDSDRNVLGSRPQRWRVRIDQAGPWIVPSVTLSTTT